MLVSVCEDFHNIGGVQVVTTCDGRWPLDLPNCQIDHVASPKEAAQRRITLAREADWSVIIAPEFDGILTALRQEVLEVGGRLLGLDPEHTDLLSHKQATCEHLERAGVPVPWGVLLDQGTEMPDDFPYPAILKRNDGAGSLGMQLVRDARQAARILNLDAPRRLERLCSGQAASVAVLCGPGIYVPLAPCWQRIDCEEGFAYQGGSLIRDADCIGRATRLALAALGSLECPRGYLGVDMILGESQDGGENKDVLIEVNPRLTTSYVGLRAATSHNLAAAMLSVVSGDHPQIEFDGDPLEFDPSGRIVRPCAKAG